MKINITKDMAKYIINEEQRKVICIIPNTRYLFARYVYENLTFTCDSLGGNEEKWAMPNKFVGIATCSHDDEWDEEKGKLIAYSRAKNNLNKCFFKRAALYVDTIDDILERSVATINHYGEKVSEVTNRREQKIAKMLGEENDA